MAAAAPGARVAKVFNLCHEDVRRLAPRSSPAARSWCRCAAYDAQALAVVRRTGGLDRAGLPKVTVALLSGVWLGEGRARRCGSS